MDKRYLGKSNLTGQSLYYGFNLLGIVVNAELHERLTSRRWKKSYIYELPVYEHSVDGLPGDLDTIKPVMPCGGQALRPLGAFLMTHVRFGQRVCSLTGSSKA